MASVMMKDGMPITVSPTALTSPRKAHNARDSRIAAQPGNGTLAMLTYDSWSVK
jgi:hypothetical protein